MSSALLFETDFSVQNKDLGGKKFDRVSRFQLESMNKDVVVVVDIATSLYPIQVNDRVTLGLCSTVNDDGTPSDGTYDQTKKLSAEAQNSEYIMHGRVFKYKYHEDNRVSIYISFGGLLMCIRGHQTKLLNIEPDSAVYLLMKRLGN
mmetsp:Transcript_25192/g.37077  ORF Transcript_25192/g.37077 Transcript_25192/m.37077 type:complete len:147 (-) Transcript_25192:21-461(-)